jgi:D-xylose transport system ATP-binding protein
VNDEPILRAANIVKRFPGVIALKGVSFDLRPGEVHALCGENGAGKSTLIKILSGIHPHGSYEGEIRLADSEGRHSCRPDSAAGVPPLQLRSVHDAEKHGMAVIYQELALVEEMTVAENIFLGAEPCRGLLINWDEIYREAHTLLQQFKIEIDAAAPVRSLGVGQKQLVEIVKALGKKSRILILDEPTAALTETEVEILLNILRDLRARGISCIYISHKLDEVFAIADRITVLRDGESVVTLDMERRRPAADDGGTPSLHTKAEIIRHMVGREIKDFFPRIASVPGEILLRVQNLTVSSSRRDGAFLRDVSFNVHAGEVLGFGGLMGAGRTELVMHLFGAWGLRISGTVELDGRNLAARTPAEAIANGLALVSEDRKRYGLVLEQSIGFNLSLSSLAGGLIRCEREFSLNQKYFDALRIKATGQEDRVGRLSGGNQQKVVLGKSLMTEPRVIFLDEPTRGIDVGAKVEVYELVNRLTAEGKAVVLISSELPELMGMSDRIIMLHEGKIGGEFGRGATQEDLMAAAMGVETGSKFQVPSSREVPAQT